MKTIDRRNTALGHQHARVRNQNAIRRICVHHSVTPPAHTTANFENWWRNPASGMGTPPVGGYHEVILVNGDMELNFNPTQIAHGVASQNADSYHICVVGNFRVNGAQPEPAQMRSLIERLRFNMDRFNVPVERVLGHNEFPGNASNTCPGQDMNRLREQLRMPSVASSTPPNHSSESNVRTHTVRAGDTLSAIARNHSTTVAEIQRLNNIANANLIRVGQVLQIPSPSSTPPPTLVNAIRVGSRVRVNNTAQRWATGQNIPNWVRGQTYTVQQIRNNNNELLLAGVISWINRNDVTLV